MTRKPARLRVIAGFTLFLPIEERGVCIHQSTTMGLYLGTSSFMMHQPMR